MLLPVGAVFFHLTAEIIPTVLCASLFVMADAPKWSNQRKSDDEYEGDNEYHSTDYEPHSLHAAHLLVDELFLTVPHATTMPSLIRRHHLTQVNTEVQHDS